MYLDAAACFTEAMGIAPDTVELMSGARTNANYRVCAGDSSYALRVPGIGTNEYIDRQSEVTNLKLVSESFDFVPKVLFADGRTGIIVSEFLVGARSLTASDIENRNLLADVAKCLATVHSSGIEFGNVFDLAKTKRSYATLLQAENASLPNEVRREAPVLEDALIEYERCCSEKLSPCHVDPNMANFMEREGRLYLLDWEYSGMCNPLFDIANMTMTDRFDPKIENYFVRCYEQAAEVDVERSDYLLTKIASDWMWLFWHLIKLEADQMVGYNEFAWRNRLQRALDNLRKIQ